MGEEVLEVVKEYKYLGLKVENKGLDKEKNGLRVKAEKQLNIINGNMHLRANHYEIMRGLWKGVAVPTVMYGMEVLEVKAGEMQGLEVVQRKAARKGLGANRYAPIETLGGEMGWSTFNERVEKAKMKYYMRLDYMDGARWPKKVMKWTEERGKTIKDYKRRVRKLGIPWQEEEERERQLRRGERTRTEMQMNKTIEKEVKRKGLIRWKTGIESKPSLKWYKKDKPSGEKCYDGSWESKLLFKARTNSLEVNERMNRWRGEREACEKCSREDEETVETLEHVIKECPWYERERQNLEMEVRRKIGDQTWERVKEEEGDMEYLLGMDKTEGDLTEVTRKFLGEVWSKRKQEGRYQRIEEQQGDHNYGDLQ